MTELALPSAPSSHSFAFNCRYLWHYDYVGRVVLAAAPYITTSSLQRQPAHCHRTGGHLPGDFALSGCGCLKGIDDDLRVRRYVVGCWFKVGDGQD